MYLDKLKKRTRRRLKAPDDGGDMSHPILGPFPPSVIKKGQSLEFQPECSLLPSERVYRRVEYPNGAPAFESRLRDHSQEESWEVVKFEDLPKQAAEILGMEAVTEEGLARILKTENFTLEVNGKTLREGREDHT